MLGLDAAGKTSESCSSSSGGRMLFCCGGRVLAWITSERRTGGISVTKGYLKGDYL